MNPQSRNHISSQTQAICSTRHVVKNLTVRTHSKNKIIDTKKQVEKIKRNHSDELRKIAQAVEKDPSKLLELIAKLDSKLQIVQDLAHQKNQRYDLIAEILTHLKAIEVNLEKLNLKNVSQHSSSSSGVTPTGVDDVIE